MQGGGRHDVGGPLELALYTTSYYVLRLLRTGWNEPILTLAIGRCCSCHDGNHDDLFAKGGAYKKSIVRKCPLG